MAARVLSRHVTVTDPEPRVDTPGFSLIRVLARVPDCWGSSGCCWGMPSSFRACYTPSLASVGSLSVPTGKGSAPITREQPGITPSRGS